MSGPAWQGPAAASTLSAPHGIIDPVMILTQVKIGGRMGSQPGDSTTARGRQGEVLAAQAVEAHGYVVVARNWRCAAGEIDLVARDGDTWVFIEVKARGGEGYGQPEEAVTAAKQTRLLRVAEAYLAGHGIGETEWRIDVVALVLSPAGKVRRLTIYRDAVRASG